MSAKGAYLYIHRRILFPSFGDIHHFMIGLKAPKKGKLTKVKSIRLTEVDDSSLSLSSISGSEDSGSDDEKLGSSSDDEDFNVGKITDRGDINV